MYNYYLGLVSSFIPGGGYTVIITGIALIAASISMIAKKYIQISCLLLALMLLIFILTIHVPGLFTGDPNQETIAFIELLKDTALMGGSLLIAGIYKENKEKI
jgi:energy-coupling factor transporter transmembrane protein EcfT